MLSNLFFRRIIIISLAVGIYVFLHSGLTLAANVSNTSDEGVEVLTRGPLHEAFADVGVNETQQGAITPRRVPDPINEIPPEFRPAGEKVVWIPGYWSWDEEKNDFIWVSGVWRDVPPGLQWTPGYWISVGSGSQYICGFWTSVDQVETVYLPPPPSNLATGPSSPPLAPQQVWLDGHWLWYQNHYAWQAGYWFEQRSDMIWIPAHYVWAPRGYVFVRGYWDYQLARRGVMFRPLYYTRPIHRNHRYFYTPSIVLNFDSVFLSLLVRRDSHHYYFGDYHGPRYQKRGYSPWYSRHATRYGDDRHYKGSHPQQLRNNSKWENNEHRQFQNRHNNKRQPTQLHQQQTNHSFEVSQNHASLRANGRHKEARENKEYSPVRPARSKTDRQRQSPVQDQQLVNIQEGQREHMYKTTKKRKSWQPVENEKAVKLTKHFSKTNGNQGKNPVAARPQEKHYTFNRVKPHSQAEGQAQNRPQKELRIRQDKRTAKRW